MLINGKWMNEPEIKSLITQLIADKSRLESQLSKKRGKWEINSDGYYPYCSECKGEPDNGKMTKYCPNCGADMRGKAGE